MGDQELTNRPARADDPDVTAAELAAIAAAMAQLTVALRAFIVTAEELYPHIKSDQRLRLALRRWRGETSHVPGGETPHADDGIHPTDP